MANKRNILTIYGTKLEDCRPGSTDWVSQGHAVTLLGAAMAAFRKVSTLRATAAIIYDEKGEPALMIQHYTGLFVRHEDCIVVTGRLSHLVPKVK